MAAAIEDTEPEVISLPPLNAPQQKVMDIVDSIPDWGLGIIGFGGSFGGGKTHNIVRLAIKLSVEFPGNRGVIGRQDFISLQTTTLLEFDEVCGRIPGLISKKYDAPPTYREIRLAHWPEGIASRVYFRGLENWKQLGSEQFGFALIDEASETELAVPIMLLGRLRHPLPPKVQRVMDRQCRVCHGTSKIARCKEHGNTIGRGMKYILFAASNPWPGWFEDWFLERTVDETALSAANGGVHFVPSRIKDNAHNLRPNYEAQLRATYSEADQRRLIDGEWGIFEGAIYPDFSPKTHEWFTATPTPKTTCESSVVSTSATKTRSGGTILPGLSVCSCATGGWSG